MTRSLITVLAVSVITSGCATTHYRHVTADGETRDFYAFVIGSTTAVEDAEWSIGDSRLRVGKAGQQQPLGAIVGEIVGAAVKAAK